MTDEATGTADLSGATLYDVERKSLVQIYDEFQEKVALVRAHRDPALEKTRSTMSRVPSLLMNRVLDLVSFLHSTLNLDLRALGIPNDPFGSVMITNVGSLGLETAYVPLVPYSRVPILLATGAIQDEAVVEEGQVVPRKVMRIHATFDHRLIDGAHAAVLSRVVRTWLEQPFAHFDPLDAAQNA
jgi:pyruvate dehydrogenase E2 component (dihydrolipoamide acetyltransferase)